MKSRTFLLIIALIGTSLIGFALYEQHVQQMAPCPLCVIQRYAYLGMVIFCLIGAIGHANKLGAGLGLLCSLGGGGTAVHHVWVQAHPGVSCGIDPLETGLNQIFTAKLLPWIFQADGLCTTEYPPLLGLSTPQWSLIWFVALALACIFVLLKRE